MEQCRTIDLLAYSSGICSDHVKVQTEQHLAQCESCREKLDDLRRERESFLSQIPFDTMDLPEVSDTVSPRILRFPQMLKRAASAAAVLAGAVLIGKIAFINEQPAMALKGTAGLHILAEQSDGSVGERAVPEFIPGERIQICRTHADSAYILILSVDTSGTVSRCFPAEQEFSQLEGPGLMTPIPYSIRLDDYIGEEYYIMIKSQKPLRVEDVSQEISASVKQKRIPLFRTAEGDTAIVRTILKKGRI